MERLGILTFLMIVCLLKSWGQTQDFSHSLTTEGIYNPSSVGNSGKQSFSLVSQFNKRNGWASGKSQRYFASYNSSISGKLSIGGALQLKGRYPYNKLVLNGAYTIFNNEKLSFIGAIGLGGLFITVPSDGDLKSEILNVGAKFSSKRLTISSSWSDIRFLNLRQKQAYYPSSLNANISFRTFKEENQFYTLTATYKHTNYASFEGSDHYFNLFNSFRVKFVSFGFGFGGDNLSFVSGKDFRINTISSAIGIRIKNKVSIGYCNFLVIDIPDIYQSRHEIGLSYTLKSWDDFRQFNITHL